LFQTLLLVSSSFQAKGGKKKKPYKRKKNAKKGKSFLSSFCSTLSLLPLAFALLLLPFYFRHFFLTFSFSQAKEKNK
jgi:hypothetical protein